MKKVSKEELFNIAKISSLIIEENEIVELMENIDSVLEYVSSLQKVTEAADGSDQIDLIRTINVTREDLIKDYDPKKILREAPKKEANYFVVPIILKQ